MNKTYRIIFNQHTGTYVAVAEFTHARGKASRGTKLLAPVVAAAGVLLMSGLAQAAPATTGGAGSDPSVSDGFAAGTICSSPLPYPPQTIYDASGLPITVNYDGVSSGFLAGNNSLAIGTGCLTPTIAAENAVAMGNGATASKGAVAIGTNALASFPNTVAIGTNAQAV